MTKNQKMLLGVGAVALVGWWLWKQQSTTSFSGGVQSGRKKLATGLPPDPGCDPFCRCTKKNPKIGTEIVNGVKVNVCADGCLCSR
jgi:hypothetical protein